CPVPSRDSFTVVNAAPVTGVFALAGPPNAANMPTRTATMVSVAIAGLRYRGTLRFILATSYIGGVTYRSGAAAPERVDRSIGRREETAALGASRLVSSGPFSP